MIRRVASVPLCFSKESSFWTKTARPLLAQLSAPTLEGEALWELLLSVSATDGVALQLPAPGGVNTTSITQFVLRFRVAGFRFTPR